MEPFVRLDAVALPIARPNVDTDQILPARYLQKPRSDNFGDYLFRDVRQDAAFVFNRDEYRGARILVAERNFGCGSSREHAPWALYDYGFRALIAPSYADIFFNNCYKNGLLPIVLSELEVARLFDEVKAFPGYKLNIDLDRQVVIAADGRAMGFDIEPFRKYCLLNGLDDIGLTLRHADKIRAFVMHAGFRRILKRSGYFQVKSSVQFVAKINREPVRSDFYTSTDRWHVTLGDSDQDR